MEESSPRGPRAAKEPKARVLSREVNREVEGMPDGEI